MKMITKENMLWSINKFLNQFFKKCMEAGRENLYVDLGA